MSTREDFIQRIMEGGEVTINDLDNSRYMTELNEIKEEAARRTEAQRIERQRAEKRKLEISEMLQLAAETKQLSDQYDENVRQCLEAMEPFADRELQIRRVSDMAWSKFNQIYHKLNGAAYDHFIITTPLLIELKEMGAVLTAIDDPLHKFPSSPPTSMVLNYRKSGK
jgi:vacuolar-type H+-ATPase subunit I/STV1